MNMKKLIFCLFLLSCESGETRQLSRFIINGTLVDPNWSGHVSWGGCSGTLLTNSWILSAKHCFDDQDPNQPDPWRLVSMGSQTAAMQKIYTHPTLDIAVAKLTEPMQMHDFTGYRIKLYDGAPESIIHKSLNCFGYGDQSFTGFQDGLLRTSILTVDSLFPLSDAYIVFGIIASYAIRANTDNQSIYFGDSGGSSFYNVPNGSSELVGVHVATTMDGTLGFDAASWGFSTWVKTVMDNN